MKRALLLLLLCGSPLLAQEKYDLLIKGGTVLDPKNNLHEIRDVAIRAHKIAAIEKNIPAKDAAKTIIAEGLYVTPGLVDIHTHVYAGTGIRDGYDGDNSVYPDGFTFRSCVTTVADAGSSGWKNFPDFKDRVIDRSKTRVFAFLNIVGSGMGPYPTEQNTKDMNAEAAAAMVKKFPGLIVGIKTAHFEDPEWTAVDRALEAGTAANVPVMVDFGVFRPERPYPELVTKKMRPGDISTHMYIDFIPMLDADGKVRSYLFEAKKRGVIFDVGHGGGSFDFRQAYPAVHQGYVPDSISTDLHTGSMNAGMKDMTNVMSKFLNLDMKLEDVIQLSTWNPAREIHHEELGQLSVGSDADIALLSIEKGNFGFVDSLGGKLEGHTKLVCEMTVRDGAIVWDLNGRARDDWRKNKLVRPILESPPPVKY
ncbi:MAG TPA: amidohydrolase/deacetylase family metallohydrolase [Candidatus Dormibacteraeota bacterium]|jgi:dihydroorotase|nr:amidohydrolase/deacetylase family metallohydrolase [Candidatus Dormibacteraeota bacterium]